MKTWIAINILIERLTTFKSFELPTQIALGGFKRSKHSAEEE